MAQSPLARYDMSIIRSVSLLYEHRLIPRMAVGYYAVVSCNCVVGNTDVVQRFGNIVIYPC